MLVIMLLLNKTKCLSNMNRNEKKIFIAFQNIYKNSQNFCFNTLVLVILLYLEK